MPLWVLDLNLLYEVNQASTVLNIFECFVCLPGQILSYQTKLCKFRKQFFEETNPVFRCSLEPVINKIRFNIKIFSKITVKHKVTKAHKIEINNEVYRWYSTQKLIF